MVATGARPDAVSASQLLRVIPLNRVVELARLGRVTACSLEVWSDATVLHLAFDIPPTDPMDGMRFVAVTDGRDTVEAFSAYAGGDGRRWREAVTLPALEPGTSHLEVVLHPSPCVRAGSRSDEAEVVVSVALGRGLTLVTDGS